MWNQKTTTASNPPRAECGVARTAPGFPKVFSNAKLDEQSQGFPDRLVVPVEGERAREIHYDRASRLV